MPRSCRLLRVRAGQEAEYDRRHRELWPELRELIELTYTSFSVFRHGRDVVVYGDEREQPPPDGDLGERWRRYMLDVLEPGAVELAEIMHVEEP